MRALFASFGLALALWGTAAHAKGGTAAQEAEDRYELIGADSKSAMWLDIDKIVSDKTTVVVWMLNVLADNDYGMTKTKFDCANETSKNLFVILYPVQGDTASLTPTGPPIPIIPGTFGDTAFAILCKHQPHDTDAIVRSKDMARQVSAETPKTK